MFNHVCLRVILTVSRKMLAASLEVGRGGGRCHLGWVGQSEAAKLSRSKSSRLLLYQHFSAKDGLDEDVTDGISNPRQQYSSSPAAFDYQLAV